MKFLPISFLILALATATALAYDPSPLQDICVATDDLESGVFVNGKFCKDLKQATADDFQFLGLNTLGISMARIDFAPGSLNPPHTHPRGTEVLVVVEGTILVGFVTSDQLNNTLFTKVPYKGDVFVFPIGLIHFQLNIGNTYALAFSGLSSQNPRLITIANAVFEAKAPISADVLTKAFQLDKKVVDYLEAQFWYDNN
ncbi:hypothetical protein EUGRSUZ_C04204 [Eucalyptus grandis]|uniref:Uncharacterized protein n=2 Tax=Eucalyptus grandis TaxID=71139 RepID=A0ACC3LKI9_EUCGR|nr:hypothetical protein EUGRSUZ_C04204 [Eucalyptus grandis]